MCYRSSTNGLLISFSLSLKFSCALYPSNVDSHWPTVRLFSSMPSNKNDLYSEISIAGSSLYRFVLKYSVIWVSLKVVSGFYGCFSISYSLRSFFKWYKKDFLVPLWGFSTPKLSFLGDCLPNFTGVPTSSLFSFATSSLIFTNFDFLTTKT